MRMKIMIEVAQKVDQKTTNHQDKEQVASRNKEQEGLPISHKADPGVPKVAHHRAIKNKE